MTPTLWARLPGALLFAVLLAPSACDDPSGGGGGVAVPTGGTAEEPEPEPAPADTTAWVAGASTSKKPLYGSGCRLAADVHFQLASNDVADDSLTLGTIGTTGVHLVISAADGAGGAVSADVELEQMFPGKSWGLADGSGTWNGASGDIVDGTLCFASKLAEGTEVAAELSFVMSDAASGAYHSVAGTFTLPGAAITSIDPITVDATLDLDLR